MFEIQPGDMPFRRSIALMAGGARPDLWSVFADYLDGCGRHDEAKAWRQEYASWCPCCRGPAKYDASYIEGTTAESTLRCDVCSLTEDFAYGCWQCGLDDVDEEFGWTYHDEREDRDGRAEWDAAVDERRRQIFEGDGS